MIDWLIGIYHSSRSITTGCPEINYAKKVHLVYCNSAMHRKWRSDAKYDGSIRTSYIDMLCTMCIAQDVKTTNGRWLDKSGICQRGKIALHTNCGNALDSPQKEEKGSGVGN